MRTPCSYVYAQFPRYGFFANIIMHFLLVRHKVILVVHDIEFLRGRRTGTPEGYISKAAGVIFSGDLEQYFSGRTLPVCVKHVCWDYLADGAPLVNWQLDAPILFAGNLSSLKNPWIEASTHIPGLDIVFFGNNLAQDLTKRIKYISAFDANRPLFPGIFSWGLVWEGTWDCLDKDRFGYEAYNQPHKFSLYMAIGLPVIVRKGSQIAQFVMKHNLGIVVGSIRDIPEAVSQVTADEAAGMRSGVLKASEKVRSGAYLRDAISAMGLQQSTL